MTKPFFHFYHISGGELSCTIISYYHYILHDSLYFCQSFDVSYMIV